MNRLPGELKRLRSQARRVFGRWRYDEAHEHAVLVYSMRLLDRRLSRKYRQKRSSKEVRF